MHALPPERWIDGYPHLIERVLEEATRPDSVDHGVRHWQLVSIAGAELLSEMDAGDPDVVFLFGLFHDSMRLNDYVDPGHGKRGGRLARSLLDHLPFATALDIETLVFACDKHTSARVSTDPTVGACWDSDRLNLWRVAIEPDPVLLSTEPARRPERIGWAEELQDQAFTWEMVCDRYATLTRGSHKA